MKLRRLSSGLCGFLFVALLTFPVNILGAGANKLNFFGHNLADFAVFTFPGAGGQINWYLLRNDNPTSGAPGAATIANIPWGQTATDLVPAFGDYAGDTRTDPILWRDNTGSPANTYMLQPATTGTAPQIFRQWGDATLDTIGAEGDYDGDGKMDFTAVRATATNSPLVWWILRSSDSTISNFVWGNNATDIPLPGADYTGDGVDDPTVARVNSISGQITWFIGTTSATQIRQVSWGNFNTDFIIPAGDYDGDGKADFMVWRGFGSVNGVWYLQTNSGNVSYIQWGIPGASGVRDTALRSGDYDGDGKTDVAIYRPGTKEFWVAKSTGGFIQQQWGGDASVTTLPIAQFGTF